MPEFLPVSSLRKTDGRRSFRLFDMAHCAMDTILEEILPFSFLDCLVIGMEECLFHSRKLYLESPRLSSYLLRDKELVLGDLGELSSFVDSLEKSKRRIVVLSTCLPNIMNLDLESLFDRENFHYLSVPQFAAVSALDSQNLFYQEVFGRDAAVEEKEEVLFLDGTTFSSFLDANGVLVLPSPHIVLQDPRYLSLCEHLEKEGRITFFDDCHPHPMEDYRRNAKLLDLPKERIDRLEKEVQLLDWKKERILKSAYGLDLLLALESEKKDSFRLLLPGLTEWTYKTLKKSFRHSLVSFDYEELLSGSEVIDLSYLDNKLHSLSAFDRLELLVKEVENACR